MKKILVDVADTVNAPNCTRNHICSNQRLELGKRRKCKQYKDHLIPVYKQFQSHWYQINPLFPDSLCFLPAEYIGLQTMTVPKENVYGFTATRLSMRDIKQYDTEAGGGRQLHC